MSQVHKWVVGIQEFLLLQEGWPVLGKPIPLLGGPLSVGDGVVGISSVLSLGSKIEVREIFPGSVAPKAPSRVSMREAVLHPSESDFDFDFP